MVVVDGERGYREQLLAIAPTLQLWVPKVDNAPSRMGFRGRSRSKASLKRLASVILQPPTFTPKEWTHDVVFENKRGTSRSGYRADPEADRRAEYAYTMAALDQWRDREANPDDYEPEKSTCEDCGEDVLFELTGSGTITELCPSCGIISAGANFTPMIRRPTAGAFGERRVMTQRRRFWQVSWVPSRGNGLRAAPDRIWLPSDDVAAVLSDPRCQQTNPKYLKRQSAYIHIIEAARQGAPISAPVPEGITPKVFREKVHMALLRHRSTMMARWSVCRVKQNGKEVLRIGPVGTWRIL